MFKEHYGNTAHINGLKKYVEELGQTQSLSKETDASPVNSSVKVWMGPILRLTISIIKKEGKLLYIMCVCGNVSRKRRIIAFTLPSSPIYQVVSLPLFPLLKKSSPVCWQAPSTWALHSLGGTIISALFKNSPSGAQTAPAESCTRLYLNCQLRTAPAHGIFTSYLRFSAQEREWGSSPPGLQLLRPRYSSLSVRSLLAAFSCLSPHATFAVLQ